MNKHGHYIERCVCGVLMGQCRCPASNKTTRTVRPCTHAKGPVEPEKPAPDLPVTLTAEAALQEPLEASFDRHPCRCVKHHSPRCNRTHIHHIWPLGMGGPDTKPNRIPLCPTTHSEVHLILEAFQRRGQVLQRQREWGQYAYLLAVRGWEANEMGEHRFDPKEAVPEKKCNMSGCSKVATHWGQWNRERSEGEYCQYHAEMADQHGPLDAGP